MPTNNKNHLIKSFYGKCAEWNNKYDNISIRIQTFFKSAKQLNGYILISIFQKLKCKNRAKEINESATVKSLCLKAKWILINLKIITDCWIFKHEYIEDHFSYYFLYNILSLLHIHLTYVCLMIFIWLIATCYCTTSIYL